jgi:exodeoxyribonuclease VII large subunit
VVTSSAGAVLRDIYHVAKRRWPAVQLVLYPVQVQGEGSAQQIAEAVRFFNAKDPVDVLIVGRGGGSIEDLWSFNEEIVVRAVFESKIPVISAVGHETDFTLADFAADVRAATPSQAAELAVPDRAELQRYVAGLMARVQQQTHKTIENKRLQLMACLQSRVMLHPQTLLAERRQRLDHVLGQLQQIGRQQLQERQHRLDLATRQALPAESCSCPATWLCRSRETGHSGYECRYAQGRRSAGFDIERWPLPNTGIGTSWKGRSLRCQERKNCPLKSRWRN